MRVVETKVQVCATRQVIMQLPRDIPVGEYDVVLVMKEPTEFSPEGARLKAVEDIPIVERWQKFFEEMEKEYSASPSVPSEHYQSLVEKYRKQGLNV